tara:strand:+ start:218 stop:940 length:723 start_codon:yes stop_codon:yes gene_type:complete
MPRKKSKKKLYFGPEVQDAIVRYNSNPDNYALRNKIYQEEIHKAFDKLAENIINTFKFTYFDYPFEDVKCEVVSFMVMNMHKYDHTKGSKAFSYFSIVAKNYLILHNNNNYKKLKMHKDVDVLKNNTSSYENQLHTEDITELTNSIIDYFDKNIIKIFNKKRDVDIAFCILELFKRREEIENYNKKALYILIREMTNVNTIHITSVVNTFKKHYKKICNKHYGRTKAKPKYNVSNLSDFF